MWRVLLVEDEPLISMMLEDEMTERGYAVVGTPSTVERALQVLSETMPDFAIVDFKLPDGDCHAVARELERRHIPFVLLTGALIDSTDIQFAKVEVLAKPVEMDKLTKALARLTVWITCRRALDHATHPGPCASPPIV